MNTKIAALHAAPKFLDRDGTIRRLASMVAEAANHGARIVVTSESYIPGFPIWALVLPPYRQHELYKRLHRNSVLVPTSSAFHQLCAIASQNDVFLSVGITERSHTSIGALYNTNLIIGPDGTLLNHHRKLVPTWAEKLVWTRGDGAGLKVISTDVARVGVLICGENTNPLARYALMAQGEQLHISTWPPAWPFQIAGSSPDYARWTEIRVAGHAFESKTFGIAVGSVLDDETIRIASDGDTYAEDVLRGTSRAVTLSVDPTGTRIGPVFRDSEGILYLELDLDLEIVAKNAHDVVAGYQRFDVFRLTVNRSRAEAVNLTDNGLERPNLVSDPHEADSDRQTDPASTRKG